MKSQWPLEFRTFGSLRAKARGQNCSISLILFVLIIFSTLSMLIVIQALLTTVQSARVEYFFDTSGMQNLTSANAPNDYRDTYNETLPYRWNDPEEIQLLTGSEGYDYWQSVRTPPTTTATSSIIKFFLFSAYYDRYRRSNVAKYLEINSATDDSEFYVRIIVVTVLDTSLPVKCCYSEAFDCRPGRLKPIREHWNLKYSAFFALCPVPATYAPTHVTLVAGEEPPANRLAIHRYHEYEQQQRTGHHHHYRLAACVKPIHYHYSKTVHLIEFIELNRLLGVEHFFFYNHSTGSEVDQVLRQYAKVKQPKRLITVLPWLLPLRSQVDIRTEGIFAALNDCLYRAKSYGYNLVMFTDLDEFIIPTQHNSLVLLMQDISSIHRQVGAFSFRNGFFYLQYPDDDELKTKAELWSNLITLRKTKRKSTLNMHRQRSKLIVIPEWIVEMGNHFVWEFVPGKRAWNIQPDIGYLHHYRVCEFGGDQCVVESKAIVDRRAHHWAEPLVCQVEKRLQSLCNKAPMMSICQLVP